MSLKGGAVMNKKYILDGKTPVLCDLMTWAEWFETPGNRTVAKTKIADVLISTVFLGLDHSWGEGPPILFETMIFGGKLDQEQERYSTWDEAEEGHKQMVERVEREGLAFLAKIVNWLNEFLKAILNLGGE